jgi:hypothetical protein
VGHLPPWPLASVAAGKTLDHPLHFHPIERFYEICQNPDRADYKLPQYCFLEPAFRGSEENDQHPPADVMNGEILIAKVYNAVHNSDIWNKCLLVVTYDEHGGFYDHAVPPCDAIPPDEHTEEFSFTQFWTARSGSRHLTAGAKRIRSPHGSDAQPEQAHSVSACCATLSLALCYGGNDNACSQEERSDGDPGRNSGVGASQGCE